MVYIEPGTSDVIAMGVTINIIDNNGGSSVTVIPIVTPPALASPSVIEIELSKLDSSQLELKMFCDGILRGRNRFSDDRFIEKDDVKTHQKRPKPPPLKNKKTNLCFGRRG